MAAGGRDYSSDDYSIPEFDAASPYYAFFGAGVEEPAEPTPAFSFFGSAFDESPPKNEPPPPATTVVWE